MLYETLLKRIKKRRASKLKGADGLTALEVSICFSGGGMSSVDLLGPIPFCVMITCQALYLW